MGVVLKHDLRRGWAVLLLVLAAAPVGGQEVRRLPPTETEPIGAALPAQYAEERMEYGNPSGRLGPPPEPLPPPEEEEGPPGARSGVFQRVIFESTWLAPGSGPRDVGITDVELKGVFGLPCPTRKWPLLIIPGYAAHLFDGPTVTDLPAHVYDGYTQFRWLPKLTPRLLADLSVTTGWYSDYEQGSGDAFRITGHGAGVYTWSETAKLVAGLSYLNRPDTNLMPIGGILWTPNEDTSYELVWPRPRIARRVYWDGQTGPQIEDWVYAAGELGGGTWAVRRADGRDDLLLSKDYRLLLGIERKVLGGLSAALEAGYVFGRKFEYVSGEPPLRPSDTVFLRANLSY